MRRLPVVLLACLCLAPAAEPENPKNRPLPGLIEPAALKGFDEWPEERRKLVALSLSEAARLKLDHYLFGSADPGQGGFDCSGSMYYLLRKVGIEPARSSAAQYEWLREHGELHEVAATVDSLDDAAFDHLEPGDLLFWAGTYQAAEGRPNKVTHVQMYLGRETDGDRPVMIGSSDGRSYRGSARCGFGVYDFRLPRKGSKSRFVGYGTPPGLVAKNTEAAD